VTILTTSYWPTYKTFPDMTVPRELEPGMKSFSQYYSSKHNHRLLNWCFSLGSATVNAKFPQINRSFDCVVGTFQMCIIYLFNHPSPDGTLSVKAIKEAMKMDEDTCVKNLKSLMLKNYKLLEIKADSGKQTPGTMQLKDDTLICINESFTSPLNRIVFPTPVLEEVYKKEIIQEDRTIAIEAAIVRIMKSRKKLDHTTLVQEVIQSLRMFRPNPQTIKQRIEQLIEREYLERDPDDRSMYRYLA
jgi:cullin 1